MFSTLVQQYSTVFVQPHLIFLHRTPILCYFSFVHVLLCSLLFFQIFDFVNLSIFLFLIMLHSFAKKRGFRFSFDLAQIFLERKISGGNVIVPGPGSRSYRVPTLPDPTDYYYCTLQLGCCIVEAICSVHLEVD